MTRVQMRCFGAGALLGMIAVVLAAATPAHAQTGFDRPGGDYASFSARGGDPAVCSERCDRDAGCRAWSFAYPTTRGQRAMCWLKSEVPARVASTCCVSGVRGGGVMEPRNREIEFGIDRLGGDYRNFEAKIEPAGESCAAACKDDARCRAWTYVRPGYLGASARCFLKNRVTPPRRKPCCVSGAVR